MDTNKLQLFLALGLTIFSIVNGQGCSWMNASNTNSPGGVGQNSINDLPTCQSMCSMNMSTTCKYGFDWDQNNPTTKCWFSTSSQTSPSNGVYHYVWGGGSNCNAAGCTSWTQTANSNSPGGVPQSGINDQPTCGSMCYTNNNQCPNGYDWDPNGSPKCWFSTSSTINTGSAMGVTHYTCNGGSGGGSSAATTPTTTTTTTTTTMATTTQAQNCGWNPTVNSNSPGGNVQSQVQSLAQCQDLCIKTQTNCQYGLDFNPNVVVNQQCWFATSATVTKNGYPGVTHWAYTCSTATTAPPKSRAATSYVASGFLVLAMLLVQIINRTP